MSNSKLRKIFALLKDVGKDNEWLHDMLPEWVGKSSLKDVSGDEASSIIKALENIKNIKPYIAGTLTEKQKKAILYLASLLNYEDDHLSNFIQFTIKDKNNVDELLIGEASAVITGLRKIYFDKNKNNAKKGR